MKVTSLIGASAGRSLNKSGKGKEVSSNRLSTGVRINSAKDDSAGLAISEKMKSQLRGLGQADRNTADGISLLNTMDGGMSSVGDILNRQRELTIQAMNDGALTESDKEKIQLEVSQLSEEITSISEKLNFNGTYPLNRKTVRDEEVYTGFVNGSTSVFDSQGSIKLTMENGNGDLKDLFLSEKTTVTVKGEGEWDLFEDFENNLYDTSGNPQMVFFRRVGDGTSFHFRRHIDINDDGSVGIKFEFLTWIVEEKDYEINMKFDLGEHIKIGDNIVNGSRGDTGVNISSSGMDITSDGSTLEINISGTLGYVEGNNSDTVFINASFFDPRTRDERSDPNSNNMNFQVGARTGDLIGLSTYNCTAGSLGVSSLNITTLDRSEQTLDSLDKALDRINTYRSEVGALHNRLSNTSNFLKKSNINLEGSKSKIQDTDMAKEMMKITKENILSQASMNVLSKVNEIMPDQVNRLLQQ